MIYRFEDERGLILKTKADSNESAVIWLLDKPVRQRGNVFVHDLIRNIIFEGYSFKGVQWHNHFIGCGFYRCDWTGIDLSHVQFEGCLFGIDDPIVQLPMLGAKGDPTYHAFAWHDGTTTRIRVGCRNFDFQEARQHWAGARDRHAMRMAVNFVEAVARDRGWPVC